MKILANIYLVINVRKLLKLLKIINILISKKPN